MKIIFSERDCLILAGAKSVDQIEHFVFLLQSLVTFFFNSIVLKNSFYDSVKVKKEKVELIIVRLSDHFQ